MGTLKVGMNIVLKKNAGYGIGGHCYTVTALFTSRSGSEVWLIGREGTIMLTDKQIVGNIEGI